MQQDKGHIYLGIKSTQRQTANPFPMENPFQRTLQDFFAALLRKTIEVCESLR
ncbi:MAG TPA: hypothetical protein VE954_42510 [Oligoflexus sp.]|uniref:hypothetical protein n=1 Tax=Oligoflexus sp. TaxID=1971216 RepID=UPI002D2F2CD1|nr:hypothetical protein [Oligoflexus sp.]HYX39812.1 hypothetical protein [Oligoflexus sp.]HYX39815.1 hypothetical protein [Oligoflexus sp.]